MSGAQNGPRMDEHRVGPLQGDGGGPVGYQHGMSPGNKRRWETGCGGRARDGMSRTGTGYPKAMGADQSKTGGNRRHATGPGIGKLVAMDSGNMGQPWGPWPREVRKMP